MIHRDAAAPYGLAPHGGPTGLAGRDDTVVPEDEQQVGVEKFVTSRNPEVGNVKDSFEVEIVGASRQLGVEAVLRLLKSCPGELVPGAMVKNMSVMGTSRKLGVEGVQPHENWV